MFQKQIADLRRIHIQPVCLHQSYHIIGVLYNASGVTMLNGMALEREQMAERDNPGGSQSRGRRHRISLKLAEGLLVNKHQIERQELRAGRVELDESRALMMQAVSQATRQIDPPSAILTPDNQINVESDAGMSVSNDGVSTG